MLSNLLHRVKRIIWPLSEQQIDALSANFNKPQQQDLFQAPEPETPRPLRHDLPGSLDLGDLFYQAVFDLGSIDQSPLSIPETLVIKSAEDTLSTSKGRSKSIPHLPTVVPLLLKILKAPNTSANDYVRIIEQDPSIASSVLKLANSAYFNPNNKDIDSFQRAVVTLGDQGLRTLLSTAIMQPIIHCKSAFYAQFSQCLWDHSLCCAVASQSLAEQRHVDPFKAYIAGLSHDIGKITIFTKLAQQFKLNVRDSTPPPFAFIQPMQKISITLSHDIARDWGFPSDVVSAFKEQINASRILAKGQPLSPLGEVLYLANLLCEAYISEKHRLIPQGQSQLLIETSGAPSALFQQLDELLATHDKPLN